MNIAELVHDLDKIVIAQYNLPGFLEQPVEVKIVMKDADLLFILHSIERPTTTMNEMPKIQFVIRPALLHDADQDTTPATSG